MRHLRQQCLISFESKCCLSLFSDKGCIRAGVFALIPLQYREEDSFGKSKIRYQHSAASVIIERIRSINFGGNTK